MVYNLIVLLILYNITIIGIFYTINSNYIKFHTLGEFFTYVGKQNLSIIILCFIFNIIGIPPFPIFMVKFNIFTSTLFTMSNFIYLLISVINIVLFYFYTNIYVYTNLIKKSPKFYYDNKYITILDKAYYCGFFILFFSLMYKITLLLI